MGVGSSTVNFQTNVTIITLAASSVFPCGWYCDSSCDTQDNVTHLCWMPCSPYCRTSRGAQSVSRCMFTCPCWMLSTICMALFLLFTYDTAKYVLCITSLSPHAHRFVYLTVLDFWYQFCTQWCMALYISYIVAHVKAGCKRVPFHTFSLSGNPGMKGIMLLTRSLGSRVKDQLPR